jgi:hypothetical protein
MDQIHFYTTFYPEKKESRLKELLTCLHNNLDNKAITSITVFNEGGDLGAFNSPKLNIINITERPTYQDFFNHINQKGNDQDIHILANTDIYFDFHIAVLNHLDLKDKALAISRWDTTESKKPVLYNHNDSQDVWIFKGRIKPTLKADFPLGVPRCDNRLLYELQATGYKVFNPAFSIKAYHIHKGQRALVYTEDDNVYKIAPPYRYLYPHNYYGFWQTLYFNTRHQAKLGSYRYNIKKVNRWWIIRVPRKIVEVITGRTMRLIGYNNC